MPRTSSRSRSREATQTKRPPLLRQRGRRPTSAVHLGNDIEIRRGSELKVALEKGASTHTCRGNHCHGSDNSQTRTLRFKERPSTSRRGQRHSSDPNPSNPEVTVTAGWTAPDGTRVYADFRGPLRTGRVTLRSEPARSNNEIVQLLVFGSADGTVSPAPYGSNTTANGATQAGAVAGGFATEGLSNGLNRLTGLDVATKIDTTNSASPRPEVEVRIARDISLQVAYVLGTPPPGTNPDTAYATLDWRFFKNWSLKTTFGDRGSSLAQIIWRLRW